MSCARGLIWHRQRMRIPRERSRTSTRPRVSEVGEGVQDLDFGRRQREAEDVCVLGDPFRIRRPWNRDDLVLDVPPQHDLCRRYTVIARDSRKPRIGQVDVQQRAVTLELHTAATVFFE